MPPFPGPLPVTRTQTTTTCLRANLEAVRTRIARASEAVGRTDPVQLLPVTKSVSADVARVLVRLGEHELAENRAGGLAAKAAALPEVRWHFVGHLQRNKARRVARLAEVLHGVDSPRLVATLGRVAAEEDRRLAVYLQVDFTGERAKHGMDEPALREALDAAAEAPNLQVLGLMAMAPLEPRPGRDAAAVFGRVAELAARLRDERPDDLGPGLSMGMSADLEAAVAAGSTCVRVGRDLFRGVPG